MLMRPAMCPAQCIQRQYIAYLLNFNIFITGTKITALAEITSAQSPALKYVSMMPMHPDMCPAQWIQLENIACLLSIVFRTFGLKPKDRDRNRSFKSSIEQDRRPNRYRPVHIGSVSLKNRSQPV
jgi:hypothetical protein